MRALASWLGFLLFCNWIVAVVGFRLGMELFADFKIEMPSVTLLGILVTGTILLWPATSFVALSSLLLALRTHIGWWLGLMVCLLCDFLALSYVMPIVTLINGLSGSDDVASVPAVIPSLFIALPVFPANVGSLLMLASFILTQFLFVTLIWNRRALMPQNFQT